MTSKVQRQQRIGRLIGEHEITSQPQLIGLLAEAGIDNIQRWVPFDLHEAELRDRIGNKMIRPTTIPQSLDELKIEQAIARGLAYAPYADLVWCETATPDQAQEACAIVRAVASERVDGASLRVLYGGSVNPGNAAELMACPDVDGALVGGASLDPESFARIVAAAG